MAKVRVRPETGTLYLDFSHRGVRCREQTAFADSPANRKAVEALAARIKKSQAKGQFSYREFFPDSPKAAAFDNAEASVATVLSSAIGRSLDARSAPTPTFSEFAELWFIETEPRWRKKYREQMRATLDRIVFCPTSVRPGWTRLTARCCSPSRPRQRSGRVAAASRCRPSASTS